MARIRLTENNLHKIIKESVKRVIKEVNRKKMKNYDFSDNNPNNYTGDDCLYFFDDVCDLKKAAKYAKMAGAYDENGKLDTDKGALIYFKRIANLDDEYAWDMDYVLRNMETIGTLPLKNGDTATVAFDVDTYVAYKEIPESYFNDDDDYDYDTEYNTDDLTTFGYSDDFYDYYNK